MPPHEYIDWEFEEWIRNIPLDKALRFNQGDKFFADKLGVPVPATEPGRSEPTIMSAIIENMK